MATKVTPLQQVVRAVQLVTAIATAAFVILLFTNEPSKPAAVPAVGTANTGEAIFATRCASCHGVDGGGGFGPALRAGMVVRDFPDPKAQEAVVANGQGSMPSFAGSLTPEQITAVVIYTRTGLQ
ncbi:MAG: cytochrome [Actinomycetota bacterium]|nr:cytochrome [Actinomycetota bacterium]